MTRRPLLAVAFILGFTASAFAATPSTSPENSGTPAGNADPVQIGSDLAKYYIDGLGGEAPNWAKRIDFNYQISRDTKPEYSLLTVQPLYQSDDSRDTVFIQGSVLRYNMLGDYRNTTNIGIGYRRLMFSDQVLLGGNVFYDRDWTFGHQRIGFGGEAKWNVLDFYANGYIPTTGSMTIGSGPFEERAMRGWDTELRTQVPFFPWANIGLKHYIWYSQYAPDDSDGWVASLQADLTPNVRLETGFNSNDSSNVDDEGRFFAKFSFHLANTLHPVAASTQFISKSAFNTTRDLKNDTLDEVRRENRVVVERRNTSTGSVVIARGN